mmetsp:Transcript_15425/g.31194  ORF Transcript_15425/g.31194 Transcript_15425/m.31194 type:complete len:267 (+) Transcript_15425:645-1445(+)
MYSSGTTGAAAGCLMKKVSCASRAGCCCGWKRASKFQNEDSTYCCVAISSKPISRKISRNIARTFISGCSEPPTGGFPAASRLSGLKGCSRHVPLTSISCVRSVTALTPHEPNIVPGVTLRLLTVTAAIRLRFLSVVRASAGMAASWSPAASIAWSCCCTASTIDATARFTTFTPSSLATSSHLFCTALARPTLAAGPAAAASLSCGMLPVPGTSAKTSASGLPPLATVLPSLERRTTFLDRFVHEMKSLEARLLHTPMRLVCSKP